MLGARGTGLERDSVANVSLITALDKSQLVERVGVVTRRQLDRICVGLDIVMGR